MHNFSNSYFSMKTVSKWKLIENDSLECLFKMDTNYFKIIIRKETVFNNALLRSPVEYIKSEEGNLLSNFSFLDSNTIYSSRHNLNYIKHSILSDSASKKYKVRENISPIVRRFLKVEDSSKEFAGIDYICEFVLGNEVKWLPVSLPQNIKDYDFIINITGDSYKKICYPKLDKKGKVGVLYHSYKHNFTLLGLSNIIDGSSAILIDINEMIRSIDIRLK